MGGRTRSMIRRLNLTPRNIVTFFRNYLNKLRREKPGIIQSIFFTHFLVINLLQAKANKYYSRL